MTFIIKAGASYVDHMTFIIKAGASYVDHMTFIIKAGVSYVDHMNDDVLEVDSFLLTGSLFPSKSVLKQRRIRLVLGQSMHAKGHIDSLQVHSPPPPPTHPHTHTQHTDKSRNQISKNDKEGLINELGKKYMLHLVCRHTYDWSIQMYIYCKC